MDFLVETIDIRANEEYLLKKIINLFTKRLDLLGTNVGLSSIDIHLVVTNVNSSLLNGHLSGTNVVFLEQMFIYLEKSFTYLEKSFTYLEKSFTYLQQSFTSQLNHYQLPFVNNWMTKILENNKN